MIILPGVRSARDALTSQLSFYWHAREASLNALTGQQGQFALLGFGTGRVLTPAAGSVVTVGRAQPRFSRVGTVNVLDLDGSTAGGDFEQVTFPMAQRFESLTVLLRLKGGWTLGASRGTTQHAFSLGGATTGAGFVRLSRGGAGANATQWLVTRQTGATSSTGVVTESAAWTWPLDLLLQVNGSTGVATLSIRDAVGLLSSAGATGAVAASGRYGGDVLALGSDAALGLGIPASHYFAKLALGLQSFTIMDGLT